MRLKSLAHFANRSIRVLLSMLLAMLPLPSAVPYCPQRRGGHKWVPSDMFIDIHVARSGKT